MISNISGTLTFWNSTPFYCGSSINVTIGSETSTITKINSVGPSFCNESGFATFELMPGTYSYSATCGSLSWPGEVDVHGGCNFYEFPYGTAMFYTAQTLGPPHLR